MTRRTFARSARLLHPREFKQVFSQGQRQTDASFTCISLMNAEGFPRLGLVVTRKNVRRAVDRNRLRRVVRESFRLHCATLPPRDIVVMLRSGAERQPNPALRESLQRHWQRMATGAKA